MLITYLTQTMHLMKEHRLLSLVSVAGTGLSLAMIMYPANVSANIPPADALHEEYTV